MTGLIGTAFSVLIRLELSSPGSQYLSGNNQLYNVIATSHGLIIIYFIVVFFKTSPIQIKIPIITITLFGHVIILDAIANGLLNCSFTYFSSDNLFPSSTAYSNYSN